MQFLESTWSLIPDLLEVCSTRNMNNFQGSSMYRALEYFITEIIKAWMMAAITVNAGKIAIYNNVNMLSIF